jgi:hypothetical protein
VLEAVAVALGLADASVDVGAVVGLAEALVVGVGEGLSAADELGEAVGAMLGLGVAGAAAQDATRTVRANVPIRAAHRPGCMTATMRLRRHQF